jgi:regulator of protease activity HflC (stomatin/prohibitin superfamily)
MFSQLQKKIHRQLKQNKRNFFVIVHQSEVAYREFLGFNRVKLNPGLNIKLPYLHSLYRLSLKETMILVKNQNAYTKDNVPVTVSGTVFYKITNPEKTCFSIENPRESIENVCESCFRAVIGRFEYDEIIPNRMLINSEMMKIIDKTTNNWGIDILRFEINEFNPQNKEIARSLEKQMQAERLRRENDLQTQADIRTAEGAKQIEILKSEGLFISEKNKADAAKYALVTNASALKEQLTYLTTNFDGNYDKASSFLLETNRLSHMSNIASANNKVVYFMDSKGTFPSQNLLVDMLEQSKKQ